MVAFEGIGIYITNKFIRFAHLIDDKNGHLESKEFQLDIRNLKNQEISGQLSGFLKENGIESENLVLGIPRNQALTRYLNVPSSDKKEIKGIVGLRINELFPYKADELVFDETVIETTSNGYSRVMIVAVPKDIIGAELSLLEGAGLVPGAAELSSVCLFNQVDKSKKDYLNYILINLEDDFLDIIVVKEGKFNLSRGVNLEGAAVEQKLLEAVKQTIYIKKTEGVNFERILLSGRGVDLKNLSSAIQDNFGIKVEIDEKLCVEMALISVDHQDRLRVNLLPEEFKMRKIKENRRRVLAYFITLILLNVLLITNIGYLRLKEKQTYLNFLKSQIPMIEKQTSLLQEKELKLELFRRYANSGKLSLERLAELYRITPEGVYIKSLEMKGYSPQGILILTGEAKDNELVLKFSSLINNSSLFSKADVRYIKKVELDSKARVDPSTALRINFEISAGF